MKNILIQDVLTLRIGQEIWDQRQSTVVSAKVKVKVVLFLPSILQLSNKAGFSFEFFVFETMKVSIDII